MHRLVAVALIVASAALAQTSSPLVPMRDGTQLRTDVWLPPSDGGVQRWPVLLRRTPYGRALPADAVAGLNALGYAMVSQDVRGRGDSQGVFRPWLDDAHDGVDTLDWIVAQSWSNGRVGTWSASAEGMVQFMLLGEGHPAHRCAHITVASDDSRALFYPGGAWRPELTDVWTAGLDAGVTRSAIRAHEVDDDYWLPGKLTPSKRAKVRAAVLMTSAQFDVFAEAPRAFRDLQAQVDPSMVDKLFMILGPWTHGGTSARQQGEVTFPPDAPYTGYLTDLVAYFDWCLKDGPRPSWVPVRYYAWQLDADGGSATGQWRTSDSWPPAHQNAVLYLRASGRLEGTPPGSDEASITLPASVASPVPSRGGGTLTHLPGVYDQTTVDQSPSVTVFELGPLTSPIDVIGEPKARIWAASATTDIDVVARLSVVAPSGKVMLVTDGIRRGRFVTGNDAIRPLTPNQPTLFEVQLGPVSTVVPPGFGLRLSLSPSSSPRYEPNPGVAVPLSENPTPVDTALTVYRDSAHPSELYLPLAAGTLPGVSFAGQDAGEADGGAALPTVDAGLGGAAPKGCGCGAAGPLLTSLLALVLVLRPRARAGATSR